MIFESESTFFIHPHCFPGRCDAEWLRNNRQLAGQAREAVPAPDLRHHPVAPQQQVGQGEAVVTSRLGNQGVRVSVLASKVALSWPSVDRFGKKFLGLINLAQNKSIQNFC